MLLGTLYGIISIPTKIFTQIGEDMKKIVALLCVCLLLLATACQKKPQPQGTNDISSANTSAHQSSEASSAESPSQVTSTATSQPVPSAPASSKPASSKPASSGAAAYTPVLDYLTLPAQAQTVYGAENIALYKSIVKAFLQYKTSVPFNTATQNPHQVMYMLHFHCPIFFVDTYIDVDFADYGTDKIRITYTSKSKSEHLQLIKKFEDACKVYLQGLSNSDTDAERALICYSRYIKNLRYDHNLADVDYDTLNPYARDNPRYKETYNAIVNGTGVCSGFAKAYSFLLGQLGVSAYTIYAGHSTKDEGHAWSMMQLGGKWYFADPTWDAASETDGSIRYFGVQTLERAGHGYKVEGYEISDLPMPNFKDFVTVRDLRFQPLWGGAYNLEFNRDANAVTYKNKDGQVQPTLSLE